MTTADRRADQRRVIRARFHFPERRTGFDRRSAGGFVGWYRDHPRVIGAALLAVILLNLTDLVLTLRALERGAREANPVMATLFDISPTLAGSFKLAVGLGVVLVIWQLRRYRRILEVSLVALAAFGAVLAYQLTVVVAGA